MTEKAISQLYPDVLIVNYANEKVQFEFNSKFPDQTMYFPKFSENFDLLSIDSINENIYMKIAKQAMEFTACQECEEEMAM